MPFECSVVHTLSQLQKVDSTFEWSQLDCLLWSRTVFLRSIGDEQFGFANVDLGRRGERHILSSARSSGHVEHNKQLLPGGRVVSDICVDLLVGLVKRNEFACYKLYRRSSWLALTVDQRLMLSSKFEHLLPECPHRVGVFSLSFNIPRLVIVVYSHPWGTL